MRRPLAALFIAGWIVSGCAVTRPPAIASTRGAGDVPSAVQLDLTVGDAETAPGEIAAVAASLTPALEAHGVHVVTQSPYHLAVALSARPVAIGITQAKDGKPAEIHWLSVSRKHNPLGRCTPRRLQVSLIGRRDGEGDVAYNGRGEFDACPGETQAMAALAQALAGDFARR